MSELAPEDCAALRLLADRLWDLSSHTDLGPLLVALLVASQRELDELEQLSDHWLQELRRDRARVQRGLEQLAGELEQTASSEPAADGSWGWYTAEEAAPAARALRALLAAARLDLPELVRAEAAAAPPAGAQIDVGAALGMVAGCVAGESEAVRRRVLERVSVAFRAWQG